MVIGKYIGKQYEDLEVMRQEVIYISLIRAGFGRLEFMVQRTLDA